MSHSDGLFFDGITKYFGGTKALNAVTLHVERGEVVALLGENGAGKSTLIKTLGGLHTPDDGRVMLDGVEYLHKPGATGSDPRVAFIHQDLGLIEWMTIAENIALTVGYPKTAGIISWRKAEEIARRALRLVDSDFDPSMRISSLTRTEKSLVAIARALVVECDYLVLDEPTASLPADEVYRLFSALRPLREKGVGMIYVSHRLDEIFQIADRAAVLRDGEVVGVRQVQHTSADELVTLIVGRKSREISKPELKNKRAVLQLGNFQTAKVQPLDLSLHHGEMVGLVGLRGAGHEDIGRALYGLTQCSGDVLLDNEVVDISSPSKAMELGVGFVAGDRIVESVAATLSICENTFINPTVRGRRLLQPLRTSKEQGAAHLIGEQVGLSPNDPSLAIEALSGGNQQKVVVGRWLGTGRKVLITEDPTAGVDVGAKAEIYKLLFDATTSGLGVMVISNDFEEVASICHRALVFSRGECVATLEGVELSMENLIQHASAGEANGTEKQSHAVN